MKGICVLTNVSNKKISGHIEFEQIKQINNEIWLLITVNIKGLTPGEHGFHIHQTGNLLEGCKSLCSHFNPDNTLHGDITDNRKNRHAGDLGNIEADSDGNVNTMIIDKILRLNPTSKYSIIGRSVVIHQNRDDLGRGGLDEHGNIINKKIHDESVKTGNAGKRVACGVIGIR